jgi:cell division protein FtsL
MSRASHARRGAARRRRWPRVVGWMTLLLSALVLVTWRQTRGLSLERELRETETEHAIAEAEAVELVKQVEELRSRARIVRVARERLGMHLPGDAEIVFLPSPVFRTAGEGRR